MPKPRTDETEPDVAEQDDVEEIDATDAEWQDEEDPTISEEIVPYEGGIVPRAQWDLKAVFQGFEGVALWCHDKDQRGNPKPALYYDVPNRGRGLTARTMRILSAMRGGFDELDLNVDTTGCYEVVIGADGKPIIESVQGFRVTVRVRDLLAGNVRIGTWTEPVVKLRTDKSGYYAAPNPLQNAIAKAKRGAYSEHFSPIIEPLLKAIMEECRAGNQFFSGQVPTWVLTALPEDEPGQERVPSAVDAKRLRAEATLGNAGRDEIVSRLRPLQATLGDAIREEFVAWGAETFGTDKVANWPARRRGEVEAWFTEKAALLKAKLDESEDGAADGAGPLGDAGDAQGGEPDETTPLGHIPTPQDVRALIGGTSKDLVVRAYEEAGLAPGKPLDDPASCARMWDALHRVREE
jgi:hypothetical protein